jgi:tetratricopeptide (TPR) repeat protein
MLELFARSFPNHEAANWVLGQLQLAYVATKQFNKAMQAGVQLLGLDPEDVGAAHNCLRSIEPTQNAELIRRWSDLTAQIARRVLKTPKPEMADDVPDWKAKLEYAKQVEQYAEYSLYFAAVQTHDTATKQKLMEALEQRNAASEYLAQLRTSQQAPSVRQVDIEEAVAATEAAYQKGQYNADGLLTAATHLMSKQKEPEKVIAYSTKVVELVAAETKPADTSDAEWEKRQHYLTSTAQWMMGLLYSTQEKFSLSDRNLRAALPMLHNVDMMTGALYHLGYVNYRLAEAGERIRIHDAVRYTQQCVEIESAVQQQCIQNLKSMKAEYNLQ